MKRTPLRKVSKKRAKVLGEYSRKRKAFLQDHPVCEAENCTNNSTDVHHKAGRVGDFMLDESHWLAACRPCHQKIEENPNWAKENGYSESRLAA